MAVLNAAAGAARAVGRLLVVNAGSSSLKVVLLGPHDDVVERWDLAAPDQGGLDALDRVLGNLGSVDAVGHRVVHGGARFRSAVLVDDGVVSGIEAVAELAPLHNRPALAALGRTRRAVDAPQVACFDTAFHATLSTAAATYAVPHDWTERLGLRRFGFHGLSHAYASRRAAAMFGQDARELRIVTAHLGAGASLCAVSGGRSVDTTMGFTPMDGLVMATRPGSVDPGALLWVGRHEALSYDALEDALVHSSGLLGVSGVSGDLREVLAARDSGDDRARLAVDVYLHRLRASVAAMAAAMGGVDTLVFTGGVGENAAEVRRRACEGLAFLGVAVESRRNDAVRGRDVVLSPPDAAVAVCVVHAREDLEIARQVRAVLAEAQP